MEEEDVLLVTALEGFPSRLERISRVLELPMPLSETPADGERPSPPQSAPSYRPWAQLLARTFAVDVLAGPKCHGRMRLLAMVQDPANVARHLAGAGEASEVLPRSPARPPLQEEPRAPPPGAP